MNTELQVRRVLSDDDATISVVSLNGVFQCFGLEDEHRENKVTGETRIPAGRYKLGVRDVGGFHSRYKKKFPFHQGMLQVLDVPGFEYILIHIGNTDEDTAGCLLVGTGCNTSGQLMVTSSTVAYKNLYNKLIKHVIAGDVWVEYIDDDM